MKSYFVITIFSLSALVVGCTPDSKSARGFSLPDGDVTAGQAIFVDLGCIHCHTIKDLELPESTLPTEISVALGGKVSRIKTYGELVTSVINPSHKLAKGYSKEVISTPEGESKMRNYNDVMTVAELIDLVAFLQSQYDLMTYTRTTYPIY